MFKYFPFAIIVTLFLVACVNIQPTPEPIQTATAVIAEVVVMDTAVPPTNTPSPSATPTQAPPPATQISVQEKEEEEVEIIEPFGFDMVNQLGGVVTAVAVQNSIAYLGVGSRLVIIDVFDPTQPKIISKSDVLPSIVRQVVIKNDLAYLALEENGIWVFNIADPMMMYLVGSIKTTIPAGHFLLNDDLAYVVSSRFLGERPQNSEQALVIIDLTDLTQPEEIGILSLPTQANKLALVDGYLYVNISPNYAGFENTLLIVDVSKPETPKLVSAVPELASPDIVIKDNQLILSEQGTLILADITDPINPLKTSQSPNLIDYFSMDFLYLDQDIVWSFSGFGDVSGCSGSLYAFDIVDSANIQTIGRTYASCDINSLTSSDNKLYLATDFGLQILDISDPAAPLYTGKWSTIPPIRQLTHGNDLYGLTESGNHIYIFDLDDPLELQKSSIFNGQYSMNSMAVTDTYLYVGTSLYPGIPILDASDPGNVIETAVIESSFLPVSFSNLIVSDRYLYMLMDVVTGVFDISEPSQPKELTTDDETSILYNQAFVLQEHTMYAWTQTTWNHGLRVIDASNPEQLIDLDFWDDELESDLRALTAEPNYVYLVTKVCNSHNTCPKQNLLRILDVNGPQNLSVMATLSIPDQMESIFLYGNSLVLAGEDIWLVNIENRTQPYISGYYPTPGNTKDVIVVNDLIYVADGAGGLLVLRLVEE